MNSIRSLVLKCCWGSGLQRDIHWFKQQLMVFLYGDCMWGQQEDLCLLSQPSKSHVKLKA